MISEKNVIQPALARACSLRTDYIMARPVKAYKKWVDRIPSVYSDKILDEPNSKTVSIENDPNCLAIIKHYRSLIPMGQEHRKPIFRLTSADGAIGAHANAVLDARDDFCKLALKIAMGMGIKF